MSQRGRPPLGAEHVQKLDGDADTKERLEVILKTLSGELSSAEACQLLDIGPSQLARLRERALAGALAALAPRSPGRPAAAPAPEDSAARVAELEEEVQELTIDLRASQLREEIAIIMPHLLKPTAAKKKRSADTPKRRLRRKK